MWYKYHTLQSLGTVMVPVPVSLICQSSGLQLHFSDLRPVGPFMAQWPLAYIPNCTRLDINSIALPLSHCFLFFSPFRVIYYMCEGGRWHPSPCCCPINGQFQLLCGPLDGGKKGKWKKEKEKRKKKKNRKIIEGKKKEKNKKREISHGVYTWRMAVVHGYW